MSVPPATPGAGEQRLLLPALWRIEEVGGPVRWVGLSVGEGGGAEDGYGATHRAADCGAFAV